MSKSKNKNKKPQQNKPDVEKELDVKAVENTDEAAESEVETAEEKAEETADEKAEETVETEDNKAEDTEIEKTDDESEEESDEKSDEESDEESDDSEKDNDEEESADDAFRKLPFIEKCKQDPIIPVMIILAFLAIIVAAIYFYLPNALTPSMGMTIDEFRTRYEQGDVSKKLLESSGSDITFRTPEYVDIDTNPSILGGNQIVTAKKEYADFFAGPFKYFHGGGIEGATRKSDNQLAYFRVYIEYSDDDFNAVWLYSANTLDALYPELTMFESMDIAMKVMNEFNGDKNYYCKGDYGFRMVAMKKEDKTYIVLDCVPKAALKPSQIREVLAEATAETSSSDSSSAVSSESSVAST